MRTPTPQSPMAILERAMKLTDEAESIGDDDPGAARTLLIRARADVTGLIVNAAPIEDGQRYCVQTLRESVGCLDRMILYYSGVKQVWSAAKGQWVVVEPEATP